jgi:diguanylate cyclase (GGDEF)-like protein/PAS domain S-box-containing protein
LKKPPIESILLLDIPEGVLFIDERNQVAYSNKNSAELRGKDVSSVLGKNFLDCHPPEKRAKVLEVVKKLKAQPELVITREIHLDNRVFELKYRAVYYQGKYLGIVATSRDVTEARKLILELEEASIRDGLTKKLFNARYFFKRLKSEIARAQRQGYSLSLIVIDVDDFKKYNDFFGHLEGDKVLKKIGNLILKVIRKEVDLAARYGGDEFLILLVDVDESQAEKVIGRLRDLFEKEKLPYIGLSLGLATLKIDDDWSSFFRRADNDLYRQKRKKKGRLIGA